MSNHPEQESGQAVDSAQAEPTPSPAQIAAVGYLRGSATDARLGALERIHWAASVDTLADAIWAEDPDTFTFDDLARRLP